MRDEKELNQLIGKLLRKERILRGASQEEVGMGINISFQQVQKYENGLNRISLAGAIMMLEHIGIDPVKFVQTVVSTRNSDVPFIERTRLLNSKYFEMFMGLPKKTRIKILALIRILVKNNKAELKLKPDI